MSGRGRSSNNRSTKQEGKTEQEDEQLTNIRDLEYDDDTTIIPRSTSVIARRLPASRPGKGGATRYVSGKMPINARNAPRNDQVSSSRIVSNSANTVSNGVLELNNAQTEEEKINALFNLQANQWKEQQQEMAK